MSHCPAKKTNALKSIAGDKRKKTRTHTISIHLDGRKTEEKKETKRNSLAAYVLG